MEAAAATAARTSRVPGSRPGCSASPPTTSSSAQSATAPSLPSRRVYDRHHRGHPRLLPAHARHAPRRPRTPSSTPSWPRIAASSARTSRSSCAPGSTRSLATAAYRAPCPARDARSTTSTSCRPSNLAAEVQRRQDLRDLLHDVGGLPEEQRAALVLAEVGEVSHDEIAQVLGVPQEKVKALVFQARSSLIASHDARETPCEDIRDAARRAAGRRAAAELAPAPPEGLSRAAAISAPPLQDQRKMLALALPVAPTLRSSRA